MHVGIQTCPQSQKTLPGAFLVFNFWLFYDQDIVGDPVYMQGKHDSTVPEAKPRVSPPYSKLCFICEMHETHFWRSPEIKKSVQFVVVVQPYLTSKHHMVSQSPPPSLQQDGGKNQKSKSREVFATSLCMKPKQVRCLLRLWYPFQESKIMANSGNIILDKCC